MANGRRDGPVLSGISQGKPTRGEYDCTFDSGDILCEGRLGLCLADSGYRKSAPRDPFSPEDF